MDKKTKAKKTIPDTICRVHRSGGYVVLSNCFVRSTNIGCDSIGLLGKINDLPPTWNFTIAGLVAICEDGETAIKSQPAELEQWGYVKKTLLMPNESPTGRISYLYDFYEYGDALLWKCQRCSETRYIVLKWYCPNHGRSRHRKDFHSCADRRFTIILSVRANPGSISRLLTPC